jgi:hypothetical protein
MITGWNSAGFFTSNDLLGCIGFENALGDFYSTDHGKTWQPCGVME